MSNTGRRPKKCALACGMRGGTSERGLFFWRRNLRRISRRARSFYSASMGSPDERQMMAIGGADPLASKVAVGKSRNAMRRRCRIICSCRCFVLIRRLWLTHKTAAIFAGIAPFAIERGLVNGLEVKPRFRIFHGKHPDKIAVASCLG